MIRIAALLTCYNRREKTIECLRKLSLQKLPQDVCIDVVIVDDGSTDMTREAILAEFPAASVLTGDGSLYWCGGMRVAWREAAKSDPELYLLVNDDTMLDEDAVAALLEIVQGSDSRVIAVAAIRDAENEEPIYGGIRRGVGIVKPTGNIESCDTFNGNAVIITRRVYCEIGILHGAYTHGMGDFDYGYQASRRGITVVQSARTLGSCGRNSHKGSWRDRTLSRAERWKRLNSPKGLPFREWMEFNRRNAGLLWPLRAITPSIRVMLGL